MAGSSPSSISLGSRPKLQAVPYGDLRTEREQARKREAFRSSCIAGGQQPLTAIMRDVAHFFGLLGERVVAVNILKALATKLFISRKNV